MRLFLRLSLLGLVVAAPLGCQKKPPAPAASVGPVKRLAPPAMPAPAYARPVRR